MIATSHGVVPDQMFLHFGKRQPFYCIVNAWLIAVASQCYPAQRLALQMMFESESNSVLIDGQRSSGKSLLIYVAVEAYKRLYANDAALIMTSGNLGAFSLNGRSFSSVVQPHKFQHLSGNTKESAILRSASKLLKSSRLIIAKDLLEAQVIALDEVLQVVHGNRTAFGGTKVCVLLMCSQ
jgi:hypothetical protein